MARKNDKIRVESAVISHIGNIRSNNEDNFFLNGDMMLPEEVNKGAAVIFNGARDTHLFAVCDGMGGLEGGERASFIAVTAMTKLFTKPVRENMPKVVEDLMREISKSVTEDSAKNGKSKTEGTTAALLYFGTSDAWVSNVGDSRVYCYRKGELKQLTRDHSMVYEMQLAGKLTLEQARKHPKANAIDHFLGMEEKKMGSRLAYTAQISVQPGDRFLICSDGLTDLVPHEHIQKMMGIEEPLKAADALVEAALLLGGKDNVTVLVVDPVGYSAANRVAEDSVTEA